MHGGGGRVHDEARALSCAPRSGAVTAWTRRRFATHAGAASLAVLCPHVARSKSKPRVIVIGGGVAGATAAKYLAANALAVTLIEPKRRYTTCFFSNLYLGGLRSLESLSYGYEALAQRHGVAVVHEDAMAIDPAAKIVHLRGGTKLSYDRLVVAPGIAFDYGAIEGYDEAASEIVPHAWTAGAQTRLLRQQLESMDDGGVFLIVAPPNPYRCPPAPYERACLVAYYFKQFKPRAKILILDAKDSYFEQDLFEDAWRTHYPGMIEWLPAEFTGGVKAVDVKGRAVATNGETFQGAVINVIPPQRAGRLAQQAGLADQSGWCPIHPLTFESTLQPDIHVLGDAAQAGAMPKSASAANSQAKLCASAIAAALNGTVPPAPHLSNTCFTILSPDDAVSDSIAFKTSADTIATGDIVVSQLGESGQTRRRTVQEANRWYAAFTRDLFG
jgi:NADPH-dependent 2,4-dienoyl-CoA reductase/sulfur reductase-like enzyme